MGVFFAQSGTLATSNLSRVVLTNSQPIPHSSSGTFGSEPNISVYAPARSQERLLGNYGPAIVSFLVSSAPSLAEAAVSSFDRQSMSPTLLATGAGLMVGIGIIDRIIRGISGEIGAGQDVGQSVYRAPGVPPEEIELRFRIDEEIETAVKELIKKSEGNWDLGYFLQQKWVKELIRRTMKEAVSESTTLTDVKQRLDEIKNYVTHWRSAFGKGLSLIRGHAYGGPLGKKFGQLVKYFNWSSVADESGVGRRNSQELGHLKWGLDAFFIFHLSWRALQKRMTLGQMGRFLKNLGREKEELFFEIDPHSDQLLIASRPITCPGVVMPLEVRSFILREIFSNRDIASAKSPNSWDWLIPEHYMDHLQCLPNDHPEIRTGMEVFERLSRDPQKEAIERKDAQRAYETLRQRLQVGT